MYGSNLDLKPHRNPCVIYDKILFFPADGVRDVPDGVEDWLVHLCLSSHKLTPFGAESVEHGV